MPETTITTGGHYIDGMPNTEYHKPEHGISTSTVKDFIADPALVKWSRSAPQDIDQMPAIDLGTDFHSYFLEPELFKETYQVLPEFNRRKPAERQAELDLIEQWKSDGIIPVTHEDMKKLEHMRLSAMAHPTVKVIMELEGGIAERSFFWNDPQTGLACKCRPDWLVAGITDNNRPAFMPDHCRTLVMDVKTIAGLDRIQKQVETFKYYVQDPFYSNGVCNVMGGDVCFVFVFVSTTLAIGRYPVQAVMLSEAAKFDGENEIRETLPKIAEFNNSGDEVWQTVLEMDRPAWATKEEDLF